MPFMNNGSGANSILDEMKRQLARQQMEQLAIHNGNLLPPRPDMVGDMRIPGSYSNAMANMYAVPAELLDENRQRETAMGPAPTDIGVPLLEEIAGRKFESKPDSRESIDQWMMENSGSLPRTPKQEMLNPGYAANKAAVDAMKRGEMSPRLADKIAEIRNRGGGDSAPTGRGFGGGTSGYAYGYGGGSLNPKQMSPLAQAALQRQGLMPTTPAPTQKPDSPLLQALADMKPFGTRAEKMARGIEGYKPVSPGNPGLGATGGSYRTRAFTQPDGGVTLVGGKSLGGENVSLTQQGLEQLRETNPAKRRMANVQDRIDNKQRMEDKLAANRAADAAERMANKGGGLTGVTSDSVLAAKSKGEAGVMNVMLMTKLKGSKLSPQESKQAYLDGSSGWAESKAVEAEMKKQELVNKSFQERDKNDYITNMTAQLMQPEANGGMGLSLGEATKLASSSWGLRSGEMPEMFASTEGGKVEVPESAQTLVDGKSPEKADKLLEREGYSKEVRDKIIEDKQKNQTPRQKRESEKQIKIQRFLDNPAGEPPEGVTKVKSPHEGGVIDKWFAGLFD